MITKIKGIEIEGFRCFTAPGALRLDSDVVLIYGKNGSGKTSLMSAIEFALTGVVADLSQFESDYPRCLRNVRSDLNIKVQLTVEGDDHSELVFGRQLNGRDTELPSTSKLSKEDSRFFSERCYLSQSRLSRLLEAYQSTEKDSSEQLLVRFMRELLGLDLLENITGGLYEAGHISRLENSSAGLARLKSEQSTLKTSLEDLERRLSATILPAERIHQTAKSLCSEIGETYSEGAWNVQEVKALRARVEGKSALQPLRALQELQGRLNRVSGFLQSVGASASIVARQTLTTRLENMLQRSRELEATLTLLIPDSVGLTSQVENICVKLRTESNLLKRVAALELELQKLVDQHEQLAKQQREVTQEANAQRELLQRLNKDLAESTQAPLSSIDSQRAHYALLRSIVAQLHGDNCPVCQRDYSEISSAGLKVKIEAEIEKLGLDIQKFESDARKRVELQDAVTANSRKLAPIEQRLGNIDRQFSSGRDSAEEAKAIIEKLKTATPSHHELETSFSTITELRAELKTAEVQISQFEEAASEVRKLSQEMNIDPSQPLLEAPALAEFISQELASRVLKLNEVSSKQKEIGEQLSALQNLLIEADEIKKRLIPTRERYELINEKLEKIDKEIKTGRKLAQAAATAKTGLLNQIFNDTLNSLWKNLFVRLARFEEFIPQLSKPNLSRGKINTQINALISGATPFDNFAAVASTGNLNTAALSLFLALNLVEQPKHRILLLDDPVQNMDDVHVMQFASLIRAIAQQGKRQVVIAVHERALFDYLSLELGPSSKGDTITTVEIVRDEGQHNSRLTEKKHSWKPDSLRFGT